jgi:hypothetical protein
MDLKQNNSVFAEINARLMATEKELMANIGTALVSKKPGRDPSKCDHIFVSGWSATRMIGTGAAIR